MYYSTVTVANQNKVINKTILAIIRNVVITISYIVSLMNRGLLTFVFILQIILSLVGT